MGLKKRFNKTIGCLAILYMLKNNIGNGTTAFFCESLSIDKELFYTYITEINLFFSEFLTIGGYYITWQIEYDRYLKRYVLIMEEK